MYFVLIYTSQPENTHIPFSALSEYTPLSMKTSLYHSLLYLITPLHQEGVIRFLKTPLDERVISVL